MPCGYQVWIGRGRACVAGRVMAPLRVCAWRLIRGTPSAALDAVYAPALGGRHQTIANSFKGKAVSELRSFAVAHWLVKVVLLV